MTKEVLKQYLDIKEEIKYIEKRIAKIKKQSAMVADTVQNGLNGKKKRISVIYGYDVERAELLKKYLKKLEKFKNKLVQQEIEVEEFIQTIEKPELRTIFSKKYYDGMNWIQIAFEMNNIYKSNKFTEDSVRKKHDRYLKKFEKF